MNKPTDYYDWFFPADAETQEILLALLSHLPFDTYQEGTDGLHAFISAEDNTLGLEAEATAIAAGFGSMPSKTLVPYQNWNELWETNFQPVQVDDFCGIRADFHAPLTGVAHEIVINPKMAFGTGHHDTTHAMIVQMRDMDFTGTKVLDYGCGTGILAILAARLGAASIEAVDIEQESYLNTLENARINEVHNILAVHGTLDDIVGDGYDIILANINRNVLLASFAALYDRLSAGGTLLISGILQVDEPLILEAVEAAGFKVETCQRRGYWSCVKLRR